MEQYVAHVAWAPLGCIGGIGAQQGRCGESLVASLLEVVQLFSVDMRVMRATRPCLPDGFARAKTKEAMLPYVCASTAHRTAKHTAPVAISRSPWSGIKYVLSKANA